MAKKSNYRAGALDELGAFVAIPRDMFKSPDYIGLSASAVKLLMDVTQQYNGKNNGRLSPAWELMKKCGWNSPNTLAKAKEELRKTELITVTRVPTKGANGKCELWALNWIKHLDYQKDFDIAPDGHNYKGYVRLQPIYKDETHRKATKLVRSALKAANKIK